MHPLSNPPDDLLPRLYYHRGIGLWSWELDVDLMSVDLRWAGLLGLVPRDCTRSSSLWARVHPQDRGALRAALQEMALGDREYASLELRIRHRDGHYLWVRIAALPLALGPQRRPRVIAGSMEDISAQKIVEDLADFENLKLRALLDASFDGIFLANSAAHIIDCNGAFLELSGFPRERLLSLSISDLEPRDLEVRGQLRINAIQAAGRMRYATRLLRGDGSTVEVEIGVSFLDQNGGLFVCSCRDISDRMAYERQLREISIRDPLTGIYNRRHSLERLEEALARSQRGERPLSVALFDLDHFKEINDRYGHQAGDQALCDFCALVGRELREYDILGRYGGEEFLVLLEGTKEREAFEVVERILRALRAHRTCLGALSFSFTASAGLASSEEFTPEQLRGDGLIALADLRLYRAKELGRDRQVGGQ